MTKTKIEWSDEVWNPVTGCSRVSPGCGDKDGGGCYAEKQAVRLQHLDAYAGTVEMTADGPRWTGKIICVGERLDQPRRWSRPRRVFVNSMSDLFHDDVPSAFIDSVFEVMARCPQHTFQVLTKRPQRMARELTRFYDGCSIGDPLPNVWIGTSIENDRYTFRVKHLLDTPAAIRWVSAEPLLGPLPSLDVSVLDWLVVGGESGHRARPMHPQWARDLRDRCLAAQVDMPCQTCGGSGSVLVYNDDADATSGTVTGGQACFDCYDEKRGGGGSVTAGPAFFFKQWGEWAPLPPAMSGSALRGTLRSALLDEQGQWHKTNRGLVGTGHAAGWQRMSRVGKNQAGRTLDGTQWDQYPFVSPGRCR